MAGLYRRIAMEIWSDPYVSALNPTEKLVFAYLLTNKFTRQMGVYEMNIEMMLMELKIPASTFQQVLRKFNNDRKILVDSRTSEVLVVNWNRYNFNKSPKARKCTQDEYKRTKSKRLKELYLSLLYLEGCYSVTDIQTYYDRNFTEDKALDNEDAFVKMTNDEVAQDIANNELIEQARARVDKGRKERKRRETKDEKRFRERMEANIAKRKTGEYMEFGEYILLKESEYADLCQIHGPELVDAVIDDMSDWLANKDNETMAHGWYVNHRAALNKWIKKEKDKRGLNNAGAETKMDRLASM